MTDYEKSRATLQDFLNTYGKCAEDPNRAGLVPEDMKEGKPQTEEVTEGNGLQQGAAGKETAADIKAHVPAGTSVEGSRVNSGDSTSGPKVEGEYKVETAQAPDEDIEKMDSVDVNVKKAAAQNILLGSRLMDIIDREFEMADAISTKQASEEAQLMYAIKCAAERQKEIHVAQVMEMLGCSAKVANELLNQVAEEDPAAVMPAESMGEEEADAILAQAAQEDVDAAEEDYDDMEEDYEDMDEDYEDMEDAEEDAEDVDVEALGEEIQSVIDQLTAEGYDEGEVAQAILEDAGITEDDIAEMIAENLAEEGLSPEDSAALVSELEGLQEEGVTPEDLAGALSDAQ